MRANNLYCVKFGTEYNYLLIWVHSAIFDKLYYELFEENWAHMPWAAPYSIALQVTVSLLSPPPSLLRTRCCWRQPHEPVQAPPSSSTVSSRKTLAPGQHVFLDDSTDMSLKGATLGYHYGVLHFSGGKSWVNVLQIKAMFLGTSRTISERLHLHFWLVCSWQHFLP